MKIADIEQQIITEFSVFEDWMDKYNYLIEMGKSLPLIVQKYKTDQFLISGCQSRVWLRAEKQKKNIFFTADSDAVITKGIIFLLIRVLSGQTPDAIISAKLDFIDRIGFKEHLSPTRSNGLVSMIKQMKLYAMAIKVKMMAEKKESNE
ncbi:MAG: SufE family protein [Bacteroidales bacterium]|nr:SufE family protein [Bacteroidales bacterium]